MKNEVNKNLYLMLFFLGIFPFILNGYINSFITNKDLIVKMGN